MVRGWRGEREKEKSGTRTGSCARQLQFCKVQGKQRQEKRLHGQLKGKQKQVKDKQKHVKEQMQMQEKQVQMKEKQMQVKKLKSPRS